MRTMTCLILLLLSPLVLGQVYTWRDANGKTVYSDTPPTGKVEARKLKQQVPAGDSNDAAARKNLAEKEMGFRKRQAEASETATKEEKSKAETEQRRENCIQAKARLQSLEAGERIAKTNEKGERIYMDDETRAKEIPKTRKDVEFWCK